MPERSFGRTVRYRRTKLGLSQSKLGELVGRSTATIRSWEKDDSRPTDPDVLATLAAILGVSERQLFDKAEVDRPQEVDDSPTVEQALATLRPPGSAATESSGSEPRVSVIAADTTSVAAEGRRAERRR
ncbi:MAG TPA: helix-turn-helix domain-containing protein, partial [Acidimicrobiia bacterium]|nr:helix-turn-helix domain-containing protein [Acidimicrobiia bacterium]